MFVAGAARVVDAVNARLVQAVIGHRQPPGCLPSVETTAADERSWRSSALVCVERAERRSGMRRASAATEEWTCTDDDWVAERRLAGGDGPRCAVVALHGWLAGGVQMAWLRAGVEPLRRQGVELWLPWLPEHGPRAAPGSLSGTRCLSADLGRTHESLCAAAGETRRLVDWLIARDYRVVVWGVSLGGWIAALVAASEARLSGAVLWTPVVDPAETLRESPLAAPVRNALHQSGIAGERWHQALDDVSPFAQRPALPSDRILVLGGVRDNVVDASTLRTFIDRWGCRSHWTGHGHITIQWSRASRRVAHRFAMSMLDDVCAPT